MPTCQATPIPHHHNEHHYLTPPIEIRPEKSIILARRYSKNHTYQNQTEREPNPDPAYIHDHYSPVLARKQPVLSKSKSVDCHCKTGDNFSRPIAKDSNTKSSPNVRNGNVKVSKFAAIIQKLDNKAAKTFLKVTNSLNNNNKKSFSGTSTNNNNTLSKCYLSNTTDKEIHNVLLSASLSDNIRGTHVFTNDQSDGLVLRKTSPSNVDCVHTELVLFDQNRNNYKTRFKTKYSPPPDDLFIVKTADVPSPNQNNNCNSTKTNAVIAVSSSGDVLDEKQLNEVQVPKQLGDSSSDSLKRRKMFRGGLRLKERLVLCVSIVAVLFTVALVLDIQMDLGLSRKHLVPSHGRVKYVVNEEGPESAYNTFRNRLLQKTHR